MHKVQLEIWVHKVFDENEPNQYRPPTKKELNKLAKISTKIIAEEISEYFGYKSDIKYSLIHENQMPTPEQEKDLINDLKTARLILLTPYLDIPEK